MAYSDTDILLGPTEEEFSLYIGKNADKYMLTRQKLLQKKFFTLNWAALLCAPFWMVYRKQWFLLIIYAIGIGTLSYFDPSSSLLGVNIVFGLILPSIYVYLSCWRIEKLKKKFKTPATLAPELQKQGGTAPKLTIIVSLVYLILAALYITEKLAQSSPP